MRGIILAAGRGERLSPLTDDMPKCNVEYKGKQLLDYTMEAFDFYDIPVTVVRGYCKDKIDVNAKFVDNDDYLHTTMVDSLFCAIKDSEDLIVSYSDIIYNKEYIKMLQDSDGFSVIIDKRWRPYWEDRNDNPIDDVETLRTENNLIIEIGGKPESLDHIEGQYIGLFKISKDLLPKVVQFYHEHTATSMTSFIQGLIDQSMEVRPVWVNGGWMEFDTLSDLQLTRR